jgi:hypothetical protein
MSFDYPNRESVFILSSAWNDPICRSALRNPLVYPWREEFAYIVHKAPWAKGDKVCAILAHPTIYEQKIIVPFEHVDVVHLSAENLSNLMRYKSRCLWCGNVGAFHKRGDDALVCFDKLHSYYIQLCLMNSKAHELEVRLEVTGIVDITYNFSQNTGKAIYTLASAEGREPLIIDGVKNLHQIVNTTSNELALG